MSVQSPDEPIFPGSGGAASIVEWLDRQLVDLRERGPAPVREALEGAGWRSGRDLSGIPQVVLEQTARTLAAAREALEGPYVRVDAAESAILLARSRFLPGG
ncbi:MAG TPA: hypothetical protein VEW03_13540 [Longimicrobiaceae bacterium]|nr:hypothetical protein [Longimicrobiaceae bacterium]